MNREQARALVTQTFTQAFDKTSVGSFVVNLLNHFDQSKAGAWNSQYIKDAFKDHVQRYERLGTYTSPDNEKLDVLIVYLAKASKLERARTAIRNFVADHLKARDEKEAALVAFVSPTEKQWRFSYVKMDYASVPTESGKVGVETHLTPARRFSYLVGEGESCHTAQTRFLALLQDTGTNPTLADIEEAFSVEAVTKEFFTKYAQLFGQIQKAMDVLIDKDKAIRQEFTKRGVNTVDFAKKLMGQIVFLYFLQKKGWLGVPKGQDWGDGPHDFLRQLATAQEGKYENFFNDVLEPLFYDTLATDRGHAAWCDRFQCRIPFLNGGLFEPLGNYDWHKIDIPLPNALFTNTKQFDGDILGTGVLDIFDRYNFTVNEAEPLEKEVAIDPEMLGKVFENLIEENRRKGLGAYYTPREIVHYMCQECLINYLDSALNADRDTVPRADIETFVSHGEQYSFYEAAKQSGTIGKEYPTPPKSIEKHAKLIDDRLASISVCDPAVGSGAFPVGMMNEIVRARNALTPYFNDVHERNSYHFKRHAIQNCLYGVDIDPGAVEIAKLRLWLSLVVDEEETKQIKPLPNLDFKVVTGNSLIGFPFKSHGLEEIERLKARFFEESDHGRKGELKRQIDHILDDCFARSKSTLGYDINFDFKVVFSEVFHAGSGFDVVIANPPYIDSEAMSKTDGELRKLIQASYTMTRGNWDIYIAFYERGFDILSSKAGLSFITPDKWISKPFGDEMRIKTTPNIFSILKAGRDVFESVNVDAIVSVFTKTPQPLLRIYEYVAATIAPKRVVRKDTLKSPFAYDWLFSDFVELLIKIETHGDFLSKYGNCENACATSDAYKLQDLVQEEPKNGKPDEYLQIINTGTIGKFVSKWGRREMVYLGSRYTRPVVNKKRFQKDFPNSYGTKAVKPKLIVKGLNLLDACLDADGTIIPGKTTLLITSDNLDGLKFLLAIVNSTLAFFYLKEKYIASSYNQGTTFTKDMINNFPVPPVRSSDRAKLISLVDCILQTKRRNPDADTASLVDEIDGLVYALYGLTKEDIAKVEASTGNRAARSSGTLEEPEVSL
jgi:type I restriction-modification system DNA methylase subunit